MSALYINLLGRFEARLASGEALPLKGRKTQALLACLALTPGKRHTRDELATLLWSDRGQSQARSSLRQSLTELRKALGETNGALLFAGRDGIALDDGAVEVDAPKFEHLIDDGSPGALQEAAALYRGELLEGIDIHDAAFENWLRDERQRLNERACEALSRLLDYQEKEDPEQAIATARRILALDPLREATHRRLMQLYAAKGERAVALKQYHICCNALATEIGLAPEPETQKIAEEVRTGAADAGDAIDHEPKQQASKPAPLPLPDKPSIAIMPFTNISGDSEQEHFADGMTENIITTLSNLPKLFVVNRDSTSKYKDRTFNARHVGREQGVKYLLDGSVRRSGDRLRISSKLIDTATGHHVWAQRYDRVVDDVFALQDEITREVISALQVKLTDGERARILARGTKSLEAWELVYQAADLLNGHKRQEVTEARRLIDEALRVDEHYAWAHTLLGWVHWMEAFDGWSETPEKSLDLAFRAARRSLAIDPNYVEAHTLLGMIHVSNREYDRAEAEVWRATSLGPNNSKAFGIAAIVANYCGNPAKAVALIRQAIRLCPIYPAWYPAVLGDAYFLLEKLDDAISTCQISLKCDPDYKYARITLAMALAEEGRISEACAEANEIMRIEPSFSIGTYIKMQPFRNEQVITHMVDGLHTAGLAH